LPPETETLKANLRKAPLKEKAKPATNHEKRCTLPCNNAIVLAVVSGKREKELMKTPDQPGAQAETSTPKKDPN